MKDNRRSSQTHLDRQSYPGHYRGPNTTEIVQNKADNRYCNKRVDRSKSEGALIRGVSTDSRDRLRSQGLIGPNNF